MSAPSRGSARCARWRRPRPRSRRRSRASRPFIYLREAPFNKLSDERAARRDDEGLAARLGPRAGARGDRRPSSAEAAGSGIVSLQADAQIILRSWIDDARLPALAAPDVLRALAAFKAADLGRSAAQPARRERRHRARHSRRAARRGRAGRSRTRACSRKPCPRRRATS